MRNETVQKITDETAEQYVEAYLDLLYPDLADEREADEEEDSRQYLLDPRF